MLRKLAIWTGGVAMLAATAIDTLSVVGRNVGFPIVGSIELVQAAILVSGTVALAVATLDDCHARVRLLTSRLPDGPRFLLGRLSRLAAALLFLALAWGSIWLAADLWSGYERSELLGVPWRVLRLLANLGLAACVAIALTATFRRRRR
jgi:TRAP-type C4-dicarboxylate transport system permease small subunit